MDNSTAFTSRLQKLLDYYSLSASGFATKIGVQRSSISHILSGRNKPSLDFVMKVLHTFEEVSIEWLVDGKGEFPKQAVVTPTNTPPPVQESNADLFSEELIEAEKVTPKEVNISEAQESPLSNPSDKKIIKVILLYADGSFDAFDR